MEDSIAIDTNDNDSMTVKNCSFIWKIINFKNRCKGVGEKIVSPVFTAGNLVCENVKWQLILYPFGDEDVNNNFLSLYLMCNLADDIAEIKSSFQCNLWDHRHIENNISEITTFDATRNVWGYLQFINRYSSVLKNHLETSANCTLSIVCSICNISPFYKNGSCHYIELFRGFDSYFLSEYLSDVVFEVENQTLNAYKIILSARSDVFSAMFNHGLVEHIEGVITVDDIKYEAMKEVLRYIYCGRVENLHLHKRELLAAADNKYNLISLKECCETAYWKDFSVDSICDILSIADLYSCHQL